MSPSTPASDQKIREKRVPHRGLTLVRRHPTSAYVALVFALSWGGVLIVTGPAGLPATRERAEVLLPLVVLAMLVGPSASGLIMPGLVEGRQGLRRLVSRLGRWRAALRWYVIALLTAPVLVTSVLLSLSLAYPAFLPTIFSSSDAPTRVLVGLAGGLAAGVFEELGWTGYAVPQLRSRWGVLRVGLVLGMIWGAWHFLVAWWGSGTDSGAFSLPVFLSQIGFYLAVLPAYRVLMVWGSGSLPVVMLMHASLTASLPLVLAPAATGFMLLVAYLVLAAPLWVGVACLAFAASDKRSATNRRLSDEVGAGPSEAAQ